MAAPFSTPNRKLTWLITGCSSGFGLSLARVVQDGGHNLIATSRNPSRTPDLVDEVEGKGGKWLELDVNSKSTPSIIEQLETSGTHIDVLVNNAGFSIYAPTETATEDEIRAQMETMYFGPLRLIKAVLPHMRKRRFGVIANMSSGASLDGRDSMGPYAGAKAGLDGLTKVLAKEIAPFNIRALTIVLGIFNTNMANAATLGHIPLPGDYKGSVAEHIMEAIKDGKIVPHDDKDKAMRAVYDLVVGEGAGAGHEAERMLPLGKDMIARVEGVRHQLQQSLDVFGSVTKSLAIDP
ncbi:NAD(P)-binding protein [Xylariaceae sp. FL0016]|nr:NAD(P)-binding protein [Xylariaceae sp. FL0016]